MPPETGVGPDKRLLTFTHTTPKLRETSIVPPGLVQMVPAALAPQQNLFPSAMYQPPDSTQGCGQIAAALTCVPHKGRQMKFTSNSCCHTGSPATPPAQNLSPAPSGGSLRAMSFTSFPVERTSSGLSAGRAASLRSHSASSAGSTGADSLAGRTTSYASLTQVCHNLLAHCCATQYHHAMRAHRSINV